MNKNRKAWLHLNQENWKHFVSLKQRTKIHTDAQVLVYALLLASRMHQHRKDGDGIMIVKPDGTTTPLNLI